jgi:hypothetical protein
MEQRQSAVVERAQVGDAPECCGERYVLREEQRGSLVRRWFTREGDPEQLPLSACLRCAAPLLPLVWGASNGRPPLPGSKAGGRAGSMPSATALDEAEEHVDRV